MQAMHAVTSVAVHVEGLPIHQAATSLSHPGLVRGNVDSAHDVDQRNGSPRYRSAELPGVWGVLPSIAPTRDLLSPLNILLTPLRGSDFNSVLQGPILNSATLFAQRILREVHFTEASSTSEE